MNKLSVLIRFCALSNIETRGFIEDCLESEKGLQQPSPFGESKVQVADITQDELFVHHMKAFASLPARTPTASSIFQLRPRLKSLFNIEDVLLLVREQAQILSSSMQSEIEGIALNNVDLVQQHKLFVELAEECVGNKHEEVLHGYFSLAAEYIRTGDATTGLSTIETALSLWQTAGLSTFTIGYQSGQYILGQAFEELGKSSECVSALAHLYEQENTKQNKTKHGLGSNQHWH